MLHRQDDQAHHPRRPKGPGANTSRSCACHHTKDGIPEDHSHSRATFRICSQQRQGRSSPEGSILGFLGRLCVIVLSVLIICSMWGSSSFRPSILSKDVPAAKTKTLIRHVTATVTTTLQPSTTTSWATTTATCSLQPSTVTSTMTERVTTKQTKTASTYYIPSPGKFTVQDSKLWYAV